MTWWDNFQKWRTDPWATAPAWALAQRAENISNFDSIRKLIMADFSKVQADVAAQTTVLQSVVVGVQALNASNADLAAQVQALKDAIAANDPAAVQAAVDALDAGVTANTGIVSGLFPAVTANTDTPAPAAADAALQAKKSRK